MQVIRGHLVDLLRTKHLDIREISNPQLRRNNLAAEDKRNSK